MNTMCREKMHQNWHEAELELVWKIDQKVHNIAVNLLKLRSPLSSEGDGETPAASQQKKRKREELQAIKAAKKVRMTCNAEREMEVYASSIVLMQYWKSAILLTDNAVHELETFAHDTLSVIFVNNGWKKTRFKQQLQQQKKDDAKGRRLLRKQIMKERRIGGSSFR